MVRRLLTSALTALALLAAPAAYCNQNFIEKYGVPEQRAARLLSYTHEAAFKNDLDPNLLLAIMAKESSFRRNAQSPDGSFGLCQVRAKVHGKLLKQLAVTNIFNERQNLRVGAHLLHHYIEKANGNIRQGLVMYSGGSNKYASAVLRLYATIS